MSPKYIPCSRSALPCLDAGNLNTAAQIAYIYDAATNRTTSAPRMTVTRTQAGMTVVNDTIVACGGLGLPRPHSCEQLWDGKWRRIVPSIDVDNWGVSRCEEWRKASSLGGCDKTRPTVT